MAKNRKKKSYAPINSPLVKPARHAVHYPQHEMAASMASDSIKPAPNSYNDAQLGFFGSGAEFIGYHTCAMLATNWLVNKCCSIPARDAIRMGYEINAELKGLRETDNKYNILKQAKELVHFGRMYGGRVALYRTSSSNPKEYYEKPFNLDGVGKGQYLGIKQIDPNWITPVLTGINLDDPSSPDFYQPTFWRVRDMLIHKSHLHIFVPQPVPDYLKPSYNFMGIPVPQSIIERVYAAERSANEAPQLLMTKRLISMQVSDSAMANRAELEANIADWITYRDNYGVKVGGVDESIQQFDTSLSDVDLVMMGQYQLVAAAANVPATKLLGTQPRGFNSTGEYEESIYREELESVQANDLSPFLERHYELVAKSSGMQVKDNISIQWAPLDSPTAGEWAAIEKVKSERDVLLLNAGAIDATEIRDRIRLDEENDYFGIEEGVMESGEEIEETE